MRVQRVAWNNYRRIPDGEIEARNHVVLIGPNDTGKSSIVRAINLCLGLSHSQLVGSLTTRDFTDPSLPLRLSVTLSDLQEADRAAFPDEVTVGSPDLLEIQVFAESDPTDADQISVRRYFPHGGHPRAPTREQLSVIGFVYVPAARAVQRELAGPAGVVQSLVTGLSLGENAEQELRRLESEIQGVFESADAVSDLRGNIANALSASLPRSVSRDSIKLMREAERLGNPLAGSALTIRDGEHDVPVSDQSDGMRALTLLAILELAHKQARIVAIDEPETHLHPVAQRAVGTALAQSDSQRVVVTHSPAIVSKFLPLDIVGLTADRRARQLKPTASIAEHEDAARFWAYRMIEPLTARLVVLLEGPSDRIAFERVAEHCGLSLDRMGVSVLDLGSAAQFPTAFELFGPAGFGLKVLGACDSDAITSWARTVGCPPTELPALGFFESSPDLEGEYVRAFGTARMASVLAGSPAIGASSLTQSCGVRSIDEITEEALLKYCRRHKVLCSLAMAAAMTSADVAAIGSLYKLAKRVDEDA